MSAIQKLKDELEYGDYFDSSILLKRYDILKEENTIDSNLYFVNQGSLRVFFIENGEEHILYFGYEKSLISALDSLISNEKSELIIQALKRTEVQVISKKTLNQFLSFHTDNKDLWNAALEEIILIQNQREKDLLCVSASERYSRIIERSPELFQEIPLKYIASYLRMTPETLSRINKS